MKISLYTAKGGAGKTPLSIQIAADFDYAFATNETYDILSRHLDDDRLLFVEIDEEFPILDNVDVVFDLAGTMNSRDHSVVSAIRQSDLVLIPIWNNDGSRAGGLKSIREVAKINKNIVVVATKLDRQKHESKKPWHEIEDFLVIQSDVSELSSELKLDIPVLPLRLSKVFDRVTREFRSVHQISNSYSLGQRNNKDLLSQIDALYEKIGEYQ